MKRLLSKIVAVAAAALFMVGCQGNQLDAKLSERLSSLPQERAQKIENAIASLEGEQKEAITFLYTHMPQADLDTLPVEYILKNIEFAYKARNEFAWAKSMDKELFFNDVLPYALMNETRDEWRESFYKMLKPLVADAKDINQAVDTINKSLKALVGVEYNTKRNKPNQSPRESMAIGMASCSGLSILLSDAFRAVGIPSRVAGTPLWVTKEGNHTWSEVWIDGRWYFTEFYFEKLDHGWFLDRCAKFEGQTAPEHQVYASSYAPVGDSKQYFPMVWATEDYSIPGVKVTDRYVHIYKGQQIAKAKGENEITVTIKVLKEGGSDKVSADRIETELKITDASGAQVAAGKSRGPNADMLDYYTVNLAKGGEFTINYAGKSHKFKANDNNQEQLVLLYM